MAVAGKNNGMKHGVIGRILKDRGYSEDQVLKF